MDVETDNYRQIEMLNQRRSRTLSAVDLIDAGTLDVEMAACAMRAMSEGASLLTAARPGGAGKSTLMASILAFLPPEVPIVTVDHPGVVAGAYRQADEEPNCYIAHEIGSGRYYGYLWGHDVADFLELIDGPRRIASSLHADTLEELAAILCSRPLGVGHESLGRVGLILFMHVGRLHRGYRRRVATFHEADGTGQHRLLFQWDATSDSFRQLAEPRDADQLEPYRRFIQELVDQREADFQAVRAKVLAFYRQRT